MTKAEFDKLFGYLKHNCSNRYESMDSQEIIRERNNARMKAHWRAWGVYSAEDAEIGIDAFLQEPESRKGEFPTPGLIKQAIRDAPPASPKRFVADDEPHDPAAYDRMMIEACRAEGLDPAEFGIEVEDSSAKQ